MGLCWLSESALIPESLIKGAVWTFPGQVWLVLRARKEKRTARPQHRRQQSAATSCRSCALAVMKRHGLERIMSFDAGFDAVSRIERVY